MPNLFEDLAFVDCDAERGRSRIFVVVVIVGIVVVVVVIAVVIDGGPLGRKLVDVLNHDVNSDTAKTIFL
jgi:hypothetical protein